MSPSSSPHIDLTDDGSPNMAVAFNPLALSDRKSSSSDRSMPQPSQKRKSMHKVINIDDDGLQGPGEVNATSPPSASQPKGPLPAWGSRNLIESLRNSSILPSRNEPIQLDDDVKQPVAATERQLSKRADSPAIRSMQRRSSDSACHPVLRVQPRAPYQRSFHSSRKRRRISTTISDLPGSKPGLSIISDDDDNDEDDEEEEEPTTHIDDQDFEGNPPEDNIPSLSAEDIIDIEREEEKMREEEREEVEDLVNREWLPSTTIQVPVLNQTPRGSIIGPEDYLSDSEIKRRLQEFYHDGVRPRDNGLLSCQKGTYTYTPGDGVEFTDGSFMRIQSIYRNYEGEVHLLGRLLLRGNFKFFVPGNETTLLMPKRRNEVVWSYNRDEGSTVGRKLEGAIRRRDIIFTNQSWPNVSEKMYKGGFTSPAEIAAKGPLFCRWKHTWIKNRDQDYEESLSKLAEEDADPKYRIKPEKLRFAWRRCKTCLGGSFIVSREYVNERGIDTQEDVHCFTFGDAFCGAGGTSRGAVDAGLHVAWGVDCNADAAESWTANFASEVTSCYQQGINEFIQDVKQGPAGHYMVDILHMSPPCQPFSLAHTTWLNIENDETNEACLLVVKDLLEALKPRIVTMEETAGLILKNDNKPWFAWVIRSFIDMGYSVGWTIANSEKHGLAQRRKRLLVVAAGPGEKLPPFPSPSHGEGCKKPLFTIRDAIGKGKIPRQATHQATISQFLDGPKPARPHTWNQQANTLTCGGGSNNYHPSGKRPYTIREIACLQGFPWFHHFATNKITIARRQIGNAFPPPLAKSVYKEIIKSLKKTDGI